MSVMSETAIGLSDLLTQGNKMIAAWREALNDLEALLYLIERASGQKGEQEPVHDDSVIPFEMKEEEEPPKPKRTATLEEARRVMTIATKAGHTANMKAMLARYGYEKLTDIKDEEIFGELLEEATRYATQNGIDLSRKEGA